jgi:hypothetical protein
VATGFGDAVRLVVVVAWPVTVTETVAEVLERKLLPPAYWTDRLYVPAASDVVVSVATPEELRVADPSSAEPLRKLTVPAGHTEPSPVNVAVNVSVWPALTGFGDAVRLAVVGEST